MIKAILIGAAFGIVLALGATATAMAQPDVDCASFNTQADAQAYLEADLTDPSGLDADSDGEACEDFDYGSASSGASRASGSSVPSSTTATGAQYQYSGAAEGTILPETGGSAPLLALIFGIFLLLGGVVAARLSR